MTWAGLAVKPGHSNPLARKERHFSVKSATRAILEHIALEKRFKSRS
jgi:hypothetical protein